MGSAGSWWLVDNRYGWVSYTYAASPAVARQNVRQRIFDAGLTEGMTWRAARQYSHSYGVGVIADDCTLDEVRAAAQAANSDVAPDFSLAEALRRRYQNRRR